MSMVSEDSTSRGGLACKGLDENLHTATKAENETEGQPLLDVIIQKSAAILKLFASENKMLGCDTGLDDVDGVRGLDLRGGGLGCEGLDKNLPTATKAENEMEG